MDIDDCKVYVGDLSRDVQKPELEQAFARYGDVKDVWIAHNPPGFAFIRFLYSRDAKRAIRAMNGKVIAGSKIRCEVAKAAGPKGGGRGVQGGGKVNNNGGGGFGNRLQGRLGASTGRIRDNTSPYERNEAKFPRFSPLRRSRSPLDCRSPRHISPMGNPMPRRNWSPSQGPSVRSLASRRSASPPSIKTQHSPMISRRSPLRSGSPVHLRRGPLSPGMRRSPYRRTPQRRCSPSPMRHQSPSPLRRSLSPPPRRPPSPRYPPADLSPGKGLYHTTARPVLDKAAGRSGRNGYERRSSRSPSLPALFSDSHSRDYILPPSSGSRHDDRRYDDHDWNVDKRSIAGGRDRSRHFPMPPPPPMPPSPPHASRSSYHPASPRNRSPPLRKRSPISSHYSHSPSPRRRMLPPPMSSHGRGSPTVHHPMTPPSRGVQRSPVARRPMSPPSRGSSSSRSRSPLQARRAAASSPRAYARSDKSPTLRPRSPPPLRARSPPRSRLSPQRWSGQAPSTSSLQSVSRSRSPWQGASRGRAASPLGGSRVRY